MNLCISKLCKYYILITIFTIIVKASEIGKTDRQTNKSKLTNKQTNDLTKKSVYLKIWQFLLFANTLLYTLYIMYAHNSQCKQSFFQVLSNGLLITLHKIWIVICLYFKILRSVYVTWSLFFLHLQKEQHVFLLVRFHIHYICSHGKKLKKQTFEQWFADVVV